MLTFYSRPAGLKLIFAGFIFILRSGYKKHRKWKQFCNHNCSSQTCFLHVVKKKEVLSCFSCFLLFKPVSFKMIALGSIVFVKILQRTSFCQYSCSTTATVKSTTFLEWSKIWFRDAADGKETLKSPVFFCESKNIDVLKDPNQFYQELKVCPWFSTKTSCNSLCLSAFSCSNLKLICI